MAIAYLLVLFSLFGIYFGFKKKSTLIIGASVVIMISVVVIWTTFYFNPY